MSEDNSVRLLLVDNFDSFVYNLAQAFGAEGVEPVVVRNDASLDELERLKPDAVVISPGPGSPLEAGVSVDAVKGFGRTGYHARAHDGGDDGGTHRRTALDAQCLQL